MVWDSVVVDVWSDVEASHISTDPVETFLAGLNRRRNGPDCSACTQTRASETGAEIGRAWREVECGPLACADFCSSSTIDINNDIATRTHCAGVAHHGDFSAFTGWFGLECIHLIRRHRPCITH